MRKELRTEVGKGRQTDRPPPLREEGEGAQEEGHGKGKAG